MLTALCVKVVLSLLPSRPQLLPHQRRSTEPRPGPLLKPSTCTPRLPCLNHSRAGVNRVNACSSLSSTLLTPVPGRSRGSSGEPGPTGAGSSRTSPTSLGALQSPGLTKVEKRKRARLFTEFSHILRLNPRFKGRDNHHRQPAAALKSGVCREYRGELRLMSAPLPQGCGV